MVDNPTPLRILIVEDEALLAMDMEATLQACGHDVIGEAVCLQTAEALPDDANPDLAFVDIQLAHGTSGLDVSSMIRRRWASTVIVFVTANVKQIPDDFEGAAGVIAKPFSHHGLVTALHYVAMAAFNPPPDFSHAGQLHGVPSICREHHPLRACCVERFGLDKAAERSWRWR